LGEIQKLTYTTLILCAGVLKRFEYCYADVRINSQDDSGTSCKNVVNFGTVTPEITRLECAQQANLTDGA